MELLEKILGQFEQAHNNAPPGRMDDLVEGIMTQIVSKDYLYPSIKQITDKYPKWLDENKSKLSLTEMENYQKQFDCFKQICRVFEENPKDTATTMNLMQQVQQYGSPPRDLVDDVMPGLDAILQNVMSSVPNAAGLPTDHEITGGSTTSTSSSTAPPGISDDIMKNGCPTQ